MTLPRYDLQTCADHCTAELVPTPVGEYVELTELDTLLAELRHLAQKMNWRSDEQWRSDIESFLQRYA